MDAAGKVQPLDRGTMAARIDALERSNAELEALIAALRAENVRLKRQQHRQAPPIPVPVTEPVCPHCGEVLVAVAPEVTSVTDLPAQPRPVVRQYAVGVCRCQACGRRVRGRHPDLPADQYGATAHRLGTRVLATAHVLHYAHGVPQRKVPVILEALTGVQVTQGR